MRGRSLGAVLAALSLSAGISPPSPPAGSFAAEAVKSGAGRQPMLAVDVAASPADRRWQARWWALKHTARRHPRKVPDWSNARYRRAARKARNRKRSR